MSNTAFASFVLASLLTGCAAIPGTESTVPDVESTDPIEVASKLAPAAAATCVQKNVESFIATWFVSSTSPRESAIRIQLRSAVGTAALVDITPLPNGSTLSIRISRHYLARGMLTERLSNDC